MLNEELYPESRLKEIRERIMVILDDIQDLWDDGIKSPFKTEDEILSANISNAVSYLYGIDQYLCSKIRWGDK